MLAPPPNSAGPPMLCRRSSNALAASLKNKTKSMRKRFLVATLRPADSPGAGGAARGDAPAAQAEAADEISNDLVDKRMDFLRLCTDRHWQFNELRRAHYSTMMILAALGGSPAYDE